MRVSCFVSLGLAVLWSQASMITGTLAPASGAELVFDLAADWSDTQNPNGPWSYNGVDGLPLPFHRPDWDSQTRIEHFSSPQPAWCAADVSRSVPMAFKSIGVAAGTIWNLDAPAGSVGMHDQGPSKELTWTSPFSGVVTVTGGVWKMRKNIGRTINWQLSVNGSSITAGTLTETDPFTSANPFDFANGSGGPSVLTIPVMSGDIIGLEQTGSDFMGIDFRVTGVPEPSTSVLAVIGLGLTGLIRRRRLFVNG